MNNKKLFKGALVLFASILMAVSCSNNSTDGGADGNGSNSNTGTKKNFGTLTTAPVATTKPTDADQAKLVLDVASKDLTAKGDDVELVINENGKKIEGATYKIIDVKRETLANGSTDHTTPKDISSKVTKENLSYDGAKIEIKAGLNLSESSGLSSNKDYDSYKVTIQISKDGYNSKSIDVYLVIYAKA